MVTSSYLPWCNRTTLPSSRSIAGINSTIRLPGSARSIALRRADSFRGETGRPGRCPEQSPSRTAHRSRWWPRRGSRRRERSSSCERSSTTRRSRRRGVVLSIWFHPMWGTLSLRPFASRRSLAKRFTVPGKIPRPFSPGASSLVSNKACIPRQIPRYGRPLSIHDRTASPISPASACAHSLNAPCPGMTKRSARSRTSGSELSSALAPARSNALATLCKFPRPRSTIATRPIVIRSACPWSKARRRRGGRPQSPHEARARKP